MRTCRCLRACACVHVCCLFGRCLRACACVYVCCLFVCEYDFFYLLKHGQDTFHSGKQVTPNPGIIDGPVEPLILS